jgi:hypothetical protein
MGSQPAFAPLSLNRKKNFCSVIKFLRINGVLHCCFRKKAARSLADVVCEFALVEVRTACHAPALR